MLSLSTPRLASIAPISVSHHRHLLPSKALSVSPPSIPKPSLLFASRLAPLDKWSSRSRFQLAAASAADPLEPEIEDDEDSDMLVTDGSDSGEGEEAEYEEGNEEDEEEEYEEGEEEEYEEGEEEEYEEGGEEEDSRIRMVLKFIWMEKNIGLGLERQTPSGESIPLTPYYFWPRKDAWEELKTVLEESNWVSQKRLIILLNQATDIINLWQQSGAPTPTV